MNPNPTLVAIDIAKHSLQVRTTQECFRIDYDKPGLGKLRRYLGKLTDAFVVCEASGGYERPLLAMLHQRGIAVSLLNPSLVRAFAASEGIRAKTDPIDSLVLLRFAQEKKPRPTPPPEPARAKVTALIDRRGHLSEQLAREKNRLEKCDACIAASIRRMIRHIESEIASIDRALAKLVKADQNLSRHDRVMQSVTGIGPITAWSVLAYLPEITLLPRNQVVALAGLAPFNRDSGTFQGRRRIYGGRAKLRRCLYMAAQSAAVHNPVIKAYLQRLLERGKPYKCAIVAAMRKLLIHLHTLLKNPDLALAS